MAIIFAPRIEAISKAATSVHLYLCLRRNEPISNPSSSRRRYMEFGSSMSSESGMPSPKNATASQPRSGFSEVAHAPRATKQMEASRSSKAFPRLAANVRLLPEGVVITSTHYPDTVLGDLANQPLRQGLAVRHLKRAHG